MNARASQREKTTRESPDDTRPGDAESGDTSDTAPSSPYVMVGSAKINPQLVSLARPISSLRADPKNARKHGQKNKGAIRGSLDEFGQQKPIVIIADGTVFAGNGTLGEAIALKWDHLACVVYSDEESARAYAIADNRSGELAKWDEDELHAQLKTLVEKSFDISKVGFDASQLDLFKSPDVADDDAPEPPKNPITKPGDVIRLGRHVLVCGDSTDARNVALALDGKRATIAFTSPPYNAGHSTATQYLKPGMDRKYRNSSDDISQAEWLDLVRRFARVALDTSDMLVINVQMLAGNKLALLEFLHEFRTHLIDIAIWDKGKCAPAYPERVMSSCFEMLIFMSPKENATRAIPTANFRGTVENVYRAPGIRAEGSEIDHSAMFPSHLPKWILDSFDGSKTGVVLDQFGGSGTTLVVAEQLQRTCAMVELDPGYCDVIVERWERLTGKRAER